MILVKPSFEILNIDKNADKLIELVARTCYKSEDKICEGSAEKLIKNLLNKNHGAMLEFSDIVVKFVVDRGVTHEMVRHRICSFAQESTRYCNYKGGVTFVIPHWITNILEGNYEQTAIHNNLKYTLTENHYFETLRFAEDTYQRLITLGMNPQDARGCLPHWVKTEIAIKANIREWRHIMKLRVSKSAHPDMRYIMKKVLNEFKVKLPLFFNDINIEETEV